MQLIFGAIVGIFTWLGGLGTFLTTFGAAIYTAFIRKYFTFAASVAAGLALILSFYACIVAAINTIAALLAPPAWIMGLAYFIPPHFTQLLSLLIGNAACRLALDWALLKLKWLNGGS